MTEQVYFNRNRVQISSTRAVFGSKTYALATITSVESRELDPDRSLPYMTVLGGLLICGAAAFLFLVLESVLGGALLLLLGLGVIALSAVWASRIKPTYAVILCTAASERRALVSANGDEIRDIVDALNQAIIDRD